MLQLISNWSELSPCPYAILGVLLDRRGPTEGVRDGVCTTRRFLIVAGTRRSRFDRDASSQETSEVTEVVLRLSTASWWGVRLTPGCRCVAMGAFWLDGCRVLSCVLLHVLFVVPAPWGIIATRGQIIFNVFHLYHLARVDGSDSVLYGWCGAVLNFYLLDRIPIIKLLK